MRYRIVYDPAYAEKMGKWAYNGPKPMVLCPYFIERKTFFGIWIKNSTSYGELEGAEEELNNIIAKEARLKALPTIIREITV